MMKKILHIGIKDYIKAVKIADRDLNLGNGFRSIHKIFRNKKAYDRKRDKRNKILES
jgi:hypothetical protein